MRKEKILLILGLWVAVLSYLGFPLFWKNVLLSLSGLIVAYLGYLIHRQSKNGKTKETFDNFSENHGLAENEAISKIPDGPN